MNKKIILCLGLLALPLELFADDSLYCPQNHRYIKIGMSQNEVVEACGEPVSKQEANQPLLQKIPVQQLLYNNQGTSNAFYGVWNISTGSGGTSLEVDIVNKKVKSVKINSNDSNAFSVCQGTNIQVGDPVGKVYYACGSPAIVNNTFINEVVPTQSKPQIWIYQPDQYQPTITLTFIDGKLQSIN